MSKLNYLIGVSIDKVVTGLINSNYKALRFVSNGTYLTLDLKRSGEAVHTIFDVGANVGQSCLSFVKSFPIAQIYSFEPITNSYNCGLQRICLHIWEFCNALFTNATLINVYE